MNLPPWHDTPVPDQAVLDRWLAKTKGQLFIDKKFEQKGSGFLGSLLCDHVYIWDEEAGTAWCDGSSIAFNPQFFAWMTPASRLTVLVHELWHTGHDHMGRRGERDPGDWNIAADYVINNQMAHWGFDFSQLLQLSPYLDHQYDGMTTEEVFDRIRKNGAPVSGQGQNTATNGAGSQMPMPSLSGDVREPASQEAKANVKAKIVKAVQAAKMAKEAGMIPGEIKEQVDEFLNPKLPWEILLARFYTELSRDDYSWKRPSRRYEDEYLPSMLGDNKLDHLIYYIDVSGSVTPEQVRALFSECRYIHEECKPKKVTMRTFDTQLHDSWVIEEGEPFAEFQIVGRGGTCLKCVHADIKRHRPTAAVVFSDLWCQPMESDPGVPVLWAVIDNPKATAPFGRVVHIDSRK